MKKLLSVTVVLFLIFLNFAYAENKESPDFDKTLAEKYVSFEDKAQIADEKSGVDFLKSDDKNKVTVDYSKPLVITTDKKYTDFKDKIQFTDENGKNVDFLYSSQDGIKHFIFPLARSAVKLKISGVVYTAVNTDEPFTLNNAENAATLSSNINFDDKRKRRDLLYLNNVPERAEENAKTADSDHYETNVQVEGVDESDIIKTDGKYIYYFNVDKINIAKKNPDGTLVILKPLKMPENIYFEDFFLFDDKLAVIGEDYNQMSITSNVILYDVKNPDNPVKIRQNSQEGRYVSSRRKGNIIYLVTEYSVYPDRRIIPYATDDVDKTVKSVDLSKFTVFPDWNKDTVTVITSIPADDKTPSERYSYFTGADTVYMSENYVAVSYTEYPFMYYPLLNFDNTVRDDAIIKRESVKTHITLYKIDGTTLSANGSNTVDGELIDQFAMDEYNGRFRAAYTSDDEKNGSSVDVFDDKMQKVGSLSGIAKGEKIYSVRFMGEKAYMVTFKQVDPFFVIDLSKDTPKITGELKIPGYSNYLHPVRDNLILGFGHDTKTGETGNIFNEGFKISLFDVSDVNNPVEIDKTIIGGAGTTSPLNYDHKSLMYRKSDDCFAFPITVYDDPDGYAGVYVYRISPSNKLTFVGRVTHDTTGFKNIKYSQRIQRAIYIGDVLYTVSPECIYANDINDMKLIARQKWISN